MVVVVTSASGRKLTLSDKYSASFGLDVGTTATGQKRSSKVKSLRVC